MKQNFMNPKVVYLVSGSGSGNTTFMHLNDCMRQLGKLLEKTGVEKEKVIKQTIFFESVNSNDYIEICGDMKRTLAKFFGSYTPSTSFIAQIPEERGNVSLEVYIADCRSDDIKIMHNSTDGYAYAVVETPNYREIYAAGLNDIHAGDIYGQAYGAFTAMKKILDNEGLTFSDIMRQWNYIEEITKVSEGDIRKQNYQVFNDVRSHFYNSCAFVNGYPSATGIGTLTGGVTLGFIAVSPGHFSVHPLKNLEQSDAQCYSDKVLVGEGIDKDTGKTTPKFERGKLLVHASLGRVYVSGTAAVVGELSLHVDDVEKQTITTIENIRKLLSPANLSKYGLTVNLLNKQFAYIRTYVKNRADMDKVRAICESSLDSKNFQYLISDICRDNLLVEIEGAVII